MIVTNKKLQVSVGIPAGTRPSTDRPVLVASTMATGTNSGKNGPPSFVPRIHSLPIAHVGNRILASLTSAEQARILTHARFIHLERSTVVSEVGSRITYCYFFIDAVANIVASFEDGRSVDVGLIGIEGMTDVSVLLGGQLSLHTTAVHVPGLAIRIPVLDVQSEFSYGRTFQQQSLRFLHSLFGQITQSAACNRSHLLHRRLCRWLLDLHDRVGSRQIELTHEMLAQTLGTNRSDISRAMSLLRSQQIVHMSRGKLQITNREMLLHQSCECYRAVHARDLHQPDSGHRQAYSLLSQ